MVKPTVRNCALSRVLIDGGASINLIFADTLDAMQIPRSDIEQGSADFHGIIPSVSSSPLGRLCLPVTFGTPDNYRTEKLIFEVADFKSSYNAILGRPALAKFMAVPHYVYMILKLPGPNGVITVPSNPKEAFMCDRASLETVGQLPEPGSADEGLPTTNPPKASAGGSTKEIPLDKSDPSKKTRIGAQLDPK